MASDHKQIVAVAAAVFRDGRVLCMRRAADEDAGAGLWETLSGRVEPGEDPFDAVTREVAEESGLEVRIDRRPVDVYTARRAGEPMVVLLYRAQHVAGEARRSPEHDALAWWTPDELAEHTTLDRLVDAVRRAAALP